MFGEASDLSEWPVYDNNLLIAGINPLARNLTYKEPLKLTEM